MCSVVTVLMGTLAFSPSLGTGVSDTLMQYRESLSYLHSVSLHVTVVVSSTSGDSTLFPQTLDYTFHYDRDTRRAEWAGKQLIHGEETHIDSAFIQDVADGQMFVSLESDRIVAPPVQTRRAILWYDYKERLASLYENPNWGGPLFGTMYGSGHRSVADLLAQSSDLRYRDERETINGVSCVVLEGTSKYGNVTAWVAPEKGHSAMKWTIEKTPQHLFAGDSISRQRLSVENWQVTFEVKKTQELVVQGSTVYVPELAVCTHRIDRPDGIADVDTYEYKISDVQLNPDFAALGAFRIEIPEGTRVFNRDAPGLRFEWRNGKPTAMEDKETAALKAEVSGEEGGPTATLQESASKEEPHLVAVLHDSPAGSVRTWVWAAMGVAFVGILGWLVLRARKA